MGYRHGPVVASAIGSPAGLTAATAHLPIVPGPRGNDIDRGNDVDRGNDTDDEVRWRGRTDRELDNRDLNDRDVENRDVENRDWSDGDHDDYHRNADGPLEYAPWVDEVDEQDAAPLPPGWRGL